MSNGKKVVNLRVGAFSNWPIVDNIRLEGAYGLSSVKNASSCSKVRKNDDGFRVVKVEMPRQNGLKVKKLNVGRKNVGRKEE